MPFPPLVFCQYQFGQGDCATCQCLDLEMTFSNGDKRSMHRVRMYHGPYLAFERMRGPPLEYSGSRGRRDGWSERPRQGMME
jgi:hypothetical protein